MNIFQQSLFKHKIRKYYKKYIKGDGKNMEERLCPRCGNTYIEYPALSRRDNKTNICPTCGQAEALLQSIGKDLNKDDKWVMEV